MALLWMKFFLVLIAGAFLVACSGGPGTFVERIIYRAADSAYSSPMSADIEVERSYARRLVENGIEFKLLKATHGMQTEHGVEFGINELESSDGVTVTRTGRLQSSPDEAHAALERLKKGAARVLDTAVKNGELGLIAATGNNSALLAYTSNYYLYTITSRSVRHLIAFQIKQAAEFDFAAEPEDQSQTFFRSSNDIAPDWKQYKKCGLSFFSPTDLKDQGIRGPDSCIARFTAPDMEISWDFGWYGTAVKAGGTDHDSFLSDSVIVDGREAEIATYRVKAKQEPLKHITQLYIKDVYPDRSKEFKQKTSLVMHVKVKEESDLETARQILLSVVFDKTN